MESVVYSCGSFIVPPGHYLEQVVFISDHINCQSPISSQYYSTEGKRLEGYKNICFNCLEEGEFALEDEMYVRNYKSFLPRCASCKAIGKESFSRKSTIGTVKQKHSSSGEENIDMCKIKSKAGIQDKSEDLEPMQSYSCKQNIDSNTIRSKVASSPKEAPMEFPDAKKTQNESSAGQRTVSKRKFSEVSTPLGNRYYLDSKTSSLRGNARNEISKFGIIKNVIGDGNCGIYATMEGLRKAGIKCTIDVNTFRKNAYDYVSKNNHIVLISNFQTPVHQKRDGIV